MGPIALLSFEGSHTQDFYALKKSIDPGLFEPVNIGSSGDCDNHWTTGVDFLKMECYNEAQEEQLI